MIQDLKPYPKYKNVCPPWFGATPSHWHSQRLGAVLEERKEINKDENVKDVLSLLRGRGVIPYSEKGNIGNKKSDDITRYKVVQTGDIVLNSMNVIIGSVGLSRYIGCLSPVYYVLYPRDEECLAEYYNNIFQMSGFQRSLTRLGNGILAHRMRIPMEKLKCEIVPRPPLFEQNAIVKFLKYTDRLISKYIRSKKKLIALLTEQKQAIIQQAVTRGLNPDVKMKPSGVDWIGDIPEHWEARRLRTLTSLIVSNVDKHTKSGEQIVRLCNYVDVYKNDFITDKISFMVATASADEITRFRIKRDDVLITKDSEDWRDIGVPSLVKYESHDLVCGYHLAILRPNTSIITGTFLHLVLQCKLIVYQMHVSAKGVTRYGLSQGDIKNLLLPLPLVSDQQAIADYAISRTAALDDEIKRAKHQIVLISEYRTRLISDVVTGKLDVRDLAASLPTELPDKGPVEDLDLADMSKGEEEALDVAE